MVERRSCKTIEPGARMARRRPNFGVEEFPRSSGVQSPEALEAHQGDLRRLQWVGLATVTAHAHRACRLRRSDQHDDLSRVLGHVWPPSEPRPLGTCPASDAPGTPHHRPRTPRALRPAAEQSRCCRKSSTWAIETLCMAVVVVRPALADEPNKGRDVVAVRAPPMRTLAPVGSRVPKSPLRWL